MSKNADLSLIVPVRGRTQLLERLLWSVRQAESVDGVRVEILVAHNGDDPQRETVERVARHYGAAFLHADGGIAGARNAAASRAAASILFFVDSDCTVPPGTLDAHVRAHKNGAVVAAGITEFVGAVNLTWRIAACAPYTMPFGWAASFCQLPWAPSCNISVDRAVFDKVGGFRALGRIGQAGEDVDFGIRLNQEGHTIVGVPDAVVLHTRETWCHPWDMTKRAIRYGSSECDLVAAHPDRAFLTFPRGVAHVALVGLCTAAVAYGRGWWLSTMVFAALAVGPSVVECWVMARFSDGRQPHAGLGALPRELSALLISIPYESGVLLSALPGGLSTVWNRFLYSDGQLIATWHRAAVRTWLVVGGLLLVLAIGGCA